MVLRFAPFQIGNGWHFKTVSIRANTRSKRNIKSLVQRRQMERAASPTKARRRKKANLTHHVILPTIPPTRTALSCSLPRQTSKLLLYSITLKSRRTMLTQQVVLTGKTLMMTIRWFGFLINRFLLQTVEHLFAPRIGWRCM